jgi:hypothetical protein
MTLLDYTPNIQSIVKKLPTHLQNKWASNVNKIKKLKKQYPSFSDLSEFLADSADIANDPAYSPSWTWLKEQDCNSKTTQLLCTSKRQRSFKTK